MALNRPRRDFPRKETVLNQLPTNKNKLLVIQENKSFGAK